MTGQEDNRSPSSPTPDAIPYVTTTLRVTWLHAAIAQAAGDAVRLPSEPVRPAGRGRGHDGNGSGNGDGNGAIGTAVYSRVTPAVYAWVAGRLTEIERKAFDEGDRDLGQQLDAAAQRWRPAAQWAERTFPQEVLEAAAPGLPEAPPRWTDTDRAVLRTLAGGGWQNEWKADVACLGKRG